MTQTRAPTGASMATGGIVVVKLDPKGEEYHIHKALLVHHSDYFRNALQGAWKESEEQAITLKDVDADTLSLFVHWLYTQKLPDDEAGWKQVMTLNNYPESQEWQEMCMCVCITAYAFGDRFLAPTFRRAANNLFAETVKRHVFIGAISRRSITYAFANIPFDRVILQRLVDDICDCWEECDLGNYGVKAMEDLPPEFIRRMPRRFLERGRKEGNDHYTENRCYLEHEFDEDMETCRGQHMRWDEYAQYAYFI